MAQSLVPVAQVLREDLAPALSDVNSIPGVDMLVAQDILPVSLRGSRFFEYFNIDPLQYVKATRAKIAANGAFPVSGLTGTRNTGNLDIYRHGAECKEMDIVDKGLAYAELAAVKRAYAVVANQYEIDVAAAIAALWAASGTTGQTAGSSLTTAAQDPIEFIKDGIIQVRKNCGLQPDGLLIQHETYLEMINHPLVVARFNGGGNPNPKNVIIGTDQFAAFLGIKKVSIAGAMTVAENATTMTSIWSNLSCYLYVSQPWSDDVPSVGATMRLRTTEAIPGHEDKGEVGDGVMLTSYDEPNPSRRVITATMHQKAITHPYAARAGYRITFPSI